MDSPTTSPEAWPDAFKDDANEDVSITTTTATTTTSEYDRFVQAVREQEAEGRKMVAEALKRILPAMIRMGHESGISSDCQMAYFKNMMGIKDLKAWALKSEYTSPARLFGVYCGGCVSKFR
ncbi:hypothetical protein V5799_014810 [Amblyomma americanum]|uniref:Uncharacterized protein n=1 Tax=Amblyomma americanum TaxID=6943 RepID=A0AAQ4E1Y5_AMBAM